MHSHRSLGKKEVVQWRGNTELKTVFKCTVWAYDQPDKGHSVTAGRYF